MRIHGGILFLLILLAWPTSAAAQDFMQGVRPSGMANAYTGVGAGGGGLYHNPAGIMRLQMYSVDGTFVYGPAGQILNATLVDSKLNPYVGAGVGYSYFFGRGEFEGVNGHDLRLTLAAPVVANRISVGATARYLSIKNGDIARLQGWTIDVGAIFRVAERFHVGLAGRNLIEACDIRERCAGLAPMLIGGGLSYGDETSFMISADFDFDLSSLENDVPIFEIGGEYFVAGQVPIRAGFRYSRVTESAMLSVGSGWRTKDAGFEVSYQHDFSFTGFGRLSAGFSIPF